MTYLPHRIFTSLIAIAMVTTPVAVMAKPKAADKKTAPVKSTPLKAPAQKVTSATTPAPSAATPEKSTDALNLASPDFDISKEPTNISADSLTLLNEKRTFTYQGKVVVTQGDMTLTADFLDGNYSEKNEIQKITARQNVVITKGPEMRANGQRAEYDAVSRTIVLTETPGVEQNGSMLTADIIKIFIDENRSVAEGNVKVTMKNAGDGLKPAAAGGK